MLSMRFYRSISYTIYLFELKLTGNGNAEDAIVQIQERNYASHYKANGKSIVLIGNSFDEKMRTIKDWAVFHR